MARIRTIKPEFFTDEHIAELDPWTRLAFIGLWCCADRAGRIEDRPRMLKVVIFPYDPKVDMDKILNTLIPRFVSRYEADGKSYLQINHFIKHQRPHHTEKESELPPFNGVLTVKQPLSNGYITLGREGKGREGKGECPEGSTRFEEFWDKYPRKEGKADAMKAWSALAPDDELVGAILAAVERQSKSESWNKDGGKYIKMPAGWIRSRRWEDVVTQPQPDRLEVSRRRIAAQAKVEAETREQIAREREMGKCLEK